MASSQAPAAEGGTTSAAAGPENVTRVTFVLYDGETDGVAVLHDGEQVWSEASFDSLDRYLQHIAPVGVPVVLDHVVRD